jgi:outer membrane protein TolC
VQSKLQAVSHVTRRAISALVVLACVNVASAQDDSVKLWVHSWAEARSWLRRDNLRVRAAHGELQRVVARTHAAAAKLLPNLLLRAGARYSLLRPVFTSADALAEQRWLDAASFIPGGSLLAELTLSAAAWKEQTQTALELAAQTEVSHATMHELTEALTTAIFTTWAAERAAARSRSSLQTASDRVRLAERMRELGRASALDVQRYIQDLSLARADVLNSEALLASAREELGIILGRAEPVGIAADFEVASLTAVEDRQAGCEPVQELSARADLQGAMLYERAAERALERTELEYLPELNLQTAYMADHMSRSAVSNTASPGLLHTWNVSATVRWTLFDGGLRSARAEAAQAERLAAEVATATSWQTVRANAARLQRLHQLADQQLDLARDVLAAAETTDTLSQRSFELGSASAFESVDAASKLRAARIQVEVRQLELALVELRQRMLYSRCP